MAKVRSPNYPALDLAAALKAARKALDKDNRNKMSQLALAKHLGHDSLSGPALGKIGALRAYGLIDGKGDDLRITNDAVHALMAPVGSTERVGATALLATRPKLFQEINKDFPTLPSLDNLKFWLIKRQFAADAAEKAANCYLATMRLVAGEPVEYDSADDEAEHQEAPMPATSHVLDRPPSTIQPPAAKSPMLQESFYLDEGPVTLSYPSAISAESYGELKAAFELFLLRAQRRARLHGNLESDAHRERRELDRERNDQSGDQKPSSEPKYRVT